MKHKCLIGSLVRFKPEGDYHDFHNAVGLVTSHRKADYVRVRWVKPVHYAAHTEHYKRNGPATISDFNLSRFEVLNKNVKGK